jgi:hypothetical protein
MDDNATEQAIEQATRAEKATRVVGLDPKSKVDEGPLPSNSILPVHPINQPDHMVHDK